MIETIFMGIGSGIILSFITGPVFFALIKTSIERGFIAGVCLASGVIVSDMIYVAVTLYGTSFLALEKQYKMQIGGIGAVILLAIGIYYLFKKVKISYEKVPSKKHLYGYFFKGFLMCIFNPAILIYWVSVASGVSASGDFNQDEVIPFFTAILLALFAMDLLKAYYANKLRSRIREKDLLKLNRVAGVLIIIFAAKLIYNLIAKQDLM